MWFRRMGLFLLTNILVVVTISLVLNLLGVGSYITSTGLHMGNLIAFCFVWGMGGSFFSLLISRWMAKMSMGVQLVDPNSRGPEREVLDMVYRMSKAAGLTVMPEVGVYESPDVNAFATGPSKNRSLVAVSTGLLRSMNRDEVEGVIGHEVAHIANGDMVTMALVQGVVNAFVMVVARIIGFVVSQNAREESRHTINFAVTFIAEILLSFLGMFVVAYFSRQREFRADAGGARVAGREKMVQALQRLSRVYDPSQSGGGSLETMKISGRTGGLLAMLSTHPPLEERIRRLQMGR
jgi:heat shock protein HtpX